MEKNKIEQFLIRLRVSDPGLPCIDSLLDACHEDITGVSTVNIDQLRLAARQLLETLGEVPLEK